MGYHAGCWNKDGARPPMTPHDRMQGAIANAKALCETSALVIAESKALVEQSARIVASLKARVC